MNKPYALLSDLHFEEWSSFSKVNPDGVNSRLQITIDEVRRAYYELRAAGGNTMILAGDIFHTRGKVSPEVLNPVMEIFQEICPLIDVYAIAGNHDLSTKTSTWLNNAASSLISVGVKINELPDHISKPPVFLVPWQESIQDLKYILEENANPDVDAIIHAPVDDIITGIPSHGLTADYLSKLGYKRVFAGHYHNYKDFGNNVYSIGATTHQTWGDIGTKAGFLLVYPDSVKRMASRAPSFIEIVGDIGDLDEEQLSVVDRNYCRAKIGLSSPEEIKEVKSELEKRGALGVIIQSIKQDKIEGSRSSAVTASQTLEQSVNEYVAKNFTRDPSGLSAYCDSILSSVVKLD